MLFKRKSGLYTIILEDAPKTKVLGEYVLIVYDTKGRSDPVLKIRYHGYHGRGPKGIWGDQRVVDCIFGDLD